MATTSMPLFAGRWWWCWSLVVVWLRKGVYGLQAVIVRGESVASRGVAESLKVVLETKEVSTQITTRDVELKTPAFVFDCGASAEDASSAFLRCVSDDLRLWTQVIFPDTEAKYLYSSPDLKVCEIRVQQCYGPSTPHHVLDAALSEGGVDGTFSFAHVDDVASALGSLVTADVQGIHDLPAVTVTGQDLDLAVSGGTAAPPKVQAKTWDISDWPGLQHNVLTDLGPNGDYAQAFLRRPPEEPPGLLQDNDDDDDDDLAYADVVEGPFPEDELGPALEFDDDDDLGPLDLDDDDDDDDDIDEDIAEDIAPPRPQDEDGELLDDIDDDTFELLENAEAIDGPSLDALLSNLRGDSRPPLTPDLPPEAPNVASVVTEDDLEVPYDRRKIPELKDLLRSRGLKVSGKKADLVKRLQDYDAAS